LITTHHQQIPAAKHPTTQAPPRPDRCAAGRARDASTDEGETRGGKGNYTGGGRDGGRGCEEGRARVHRGIRDRRDACGRLRDDAAEVGAGRDWRLAGITLRRGQVQPPLPAHMPAAEIFIIVSSHHRPKLGRLWSI